MVQNFLGKRILVITAHPDDESYSASGAIFQNPRAGGKTFLVCATLGEKGISHLKKKISAHSLKIIRKKELTQAAKYLGISKIHILGLGDGKLKSQTESFLKKALPLAKKIKPEIILSFGKDGISGHLDHIATGKVAEIIAKKLKLPLVKFAVSPYISKNGPKWFALRRRHSNYSKKIVLPKGNIKVAVPKGVKLKALRYYPSQIDGKNPFSYYPPKAIKDMINAEYFISE